MTAKKVTKKTEPQLYSIDSSYGLEGPIEGLEGVKEQLEEWAFDDDETVTVYKLVPFKKYKKSQGYVEAN